MGITQIPSAEGFNPTNYPLTRIVENSVSLSVDNTYEDLLNISGSGFLSLSILKPNSSVNSFIKITIDGVIKYEGYSDGTPDIAGIYSTNNAGTSTSYERPINPGLTTYSGIGIGIVGLPYTGAGQYCSRITQPLYFSNSLQIEAKQTTVSGNTINYEIEYGSDA